MFPTASWAAPPGNPIHRHPANRARHAPQHSPCLWPPTSAHGTSRQFYAGGWPCRLSSHQAPMTLALKHWTFPSFPYSGLVGPHPLQVTVRASWLMPFPPAPSAMTWPGIESAAHTTDSLQLCSSALPLAKVPHLNSEDTGSLTTWPLASFLAKPHTCVPWISRSQISSYTTFHFLKTRQLAHTPRWPEIPFQFPTGKQAQTWPALEESPSVPGEPTLLNSVPTASPPPVLPCALVHSFSYLVFSFTFASSGHST